MGETNCEDMAGEAYVRTWSCHPAQRAGPVGPGAVGGRSIRVEPRS